MSSRWQRISTGISTCPTSTISGTFFYLCSILDGYSRYIVNWDLRESMTEADIEIILERAKELHLEARPRIISDNGLNASTIFLTRRKITLRSRVASCRDKRKPNQASEWSSTNVRDPAHHNQHKIRAQVQSLHSA